MGAAAPAALPPEVSAAVAARLADQSGVGMAIGLLEGGKTTTYQVGSAGTSRPLDEHTLFEIGSITKTFTATLLALMVRDGEVRLDDPVAKYLPAGVHVPERNGKKITLLNLATHRSGLPRLPTNMDPAAPDPYVHYSLKALYSFLTSYQLPRDPGAEFEYSNLGLGLLGEALALRARMPYAKLLRERVLAPLGMNETSVVLPASERLQVAVGHDADGDVTQAWNFDALAPAGAIRSSVADMLKYARCNLGQGPLAEACLFAQAPRETNADGSKIGLTWYTGPTRHTIYHGGGTGGYRSEIVIAPDHKAAAVVLTNGISENQDIAIRMFDPTYPITPTRIVAKLDGATLDEYAGKYSGLDGGSVIVTRKGDRIMAQLMGQPAVRIYPFEKDRFYYRVVAANVDFARDPSGKVNAFVLHQDGKDLMAVREGMVAPASIPKPAVPPIVALDSSTLDGYAGTYTSSQGLGFTVTHTADKLMVQLTGQPANEVFASGKDHFFYTVVDAKIDFERDGAGQVTGLVLRQNGYVISAPKK